MFRAQRDGIHVFNLDWLREVLPSSRITVAWRDVSSGRLVVHPVAGSSCIPVAEDGNLPLESAARAAWGTRHVAQADGICFVFFSTAQGTQGLLAADLAEHGVKDGNGLEELQRTPESRRGIPSGPSFSPICHYLNTGYSIATRPEQL